MAGSRETRYLDFDNLVLMLRDLVGDDDFLRKFFVAGRYKENLAVKTKLADNSVPRTLRDVHHSAFRPPARLAQRDLHLDLVSVHRGSGEYGRNEDVAFHALDLLGWNHETISFAVQEDCSIDQAPPPSFVSASLVPVKPPFFHECGEDVFDLTARQRRGLKIREDGVETGAAAFRLLNTTKNVF